MSTAGPDRRGPGAACSGAMYCGVPSSEPLSVRSASPSRSLARPKSTTLGSPSAVIRTFDGLRSRWTTPRRWACSTAPASVRISRARLVGGPRGPRQGRGEAPARHVLEDDDRAALVLTDLEDLDDVRVLEPRHGLGLAAEPGQAVGPGVVAGQDHLQGNGPVEPEVLGPVDDPHAAAAQHRLDDEARDRDVGRVGGAGPLAVEGGDVARLDPVVDLEEQAERPGQVGEAGEILVEPGGLAAAAAEQDLVIDQVERRLGVPRQLRPRAEVPLGRRQRVAGPVEALLVEPRRRAGRCGQAKGSSPSPRVWLIRSRARARRLRTASGCSPASAAISAQGRPRPRSSESHRSASVIRSRNARTRS